MGYSGKVLDLMEYADDAAAQAAYVSSDPLTIDRCTGGTASTSSQYTVDYSAAKAFDDKGRTSIFFQS